MEAKINSIKTKKIISSLYENDHLVSNERFLDFTKEVFNKLGNIEKISHYDKGEIFSYAGFLAEKIDYKYNVFGDLIIVWTNRLSSYQGGVFEIAYNYEYDSNQSWIKRTKIKGVDSQKPNLITREIEYYP